MWGVKPVTNIWISDAYVLFLASCACSVYMHPNTQAVQVQLQVHSKSFWKQHTLLLLVGWTRKLNVNLIKLCWAAHACLKCSTWWFTQKEASFWEKAFWNGAGFLECLSLFHPQVTNNQLLIHFLLILINFSTVCLPLTSLSPQCNSFLCPYCMLL